MTRPTKPIDLLTEADGRIFVDRKARAFLVLAPKLGDDVANLALALLLSAGLQIVGEKS